MRWPWTRTPPPAPSPEALGEILPRLTCQAATMRRELGYLSREILAVNVALERVRAQLTNMEETPLLMNLEPTEFTEGRRQR